MKLEKRDVAQCLGLVYNCERYHDGYGNNYEFGFNGKAIGITGWNTVEEAWEEASDKVLNPLVELLKERL